MIDRTNLIVAYLIRLENLGMTSVSRAEIEAYFAPIGQGDCSADIDNLIRNKTLLSLRNGKVTLNKVKLRKKYRN